MKMGIDISTFQNKLNFKVAKEENVKFVIIRGGFTGSANKSLNKDDRFEQHYKNAVANNLSVGVYYFSRATSYNEGKKEAEFLYNNCLKNKKFQYPIYIDVEDNYYQQKATKEQIDSAIKGFCEYIESKKGYAGVYCNLNWANNYMNYNELSKKYDFWLAYWGKEKPSRNKYGNYGVWQYGGETNYIRSNKIDNMVVDQNFSYKNYEEIMDKNNLNNFIEKETINIDDSVNDKEEIKDEQDINDNDDIKDEDNINNDNDIKDEDNINNEDNINENKISFFTKLFKKIYNFIINLFKKNKK